MTPLPFLRSLFPARAAATALASAALALSSCMELDTVIHVKEDGSGEIAANSYFSPQVTGMLGMMAGLSGLPGTEGAAPPSPDDLLRPSREALEEGAAGYGEGVRYAGHAAGQNGAGWRGYEVGYEFDDVSMLRIDPTNPPGPLGQLARMNPQAAAALESAGETESPVKFALADGVLRVETGVSPDSLSQIGPVGDLSGALGGRVGGPDGGAIPLEAGMQMAAGMLQGLRLAWAIQPVGPVAAIEASHVEDTLVIMSDVEPAKMMSDPDFIALVKEAEALQGQEPAPGQIEAMMERANAIDGLKMETRDQIFIRFR